MNGIGRSVVGFIFTLGCSITWAQQVEAPVLRLHRLPDDWGYSVLTRRLRDMAGKGAINCGGVRLQRVPRPVTDCALNAYKSAESFYARYEAYDAQGFDTQAEIGLVFDGRTIQVVVWEHDGLLWGKKETMTDQTCQPPLKLVKTSTGFGLNCFQPRLDVHSRFRWPDGYTKPFDISF